MTEEPRKEQYPRVEATKPHFEAFLKHLSNPKVWVISIGIAALFVLIIFVGPLVWFFITRS